jgi:transcriptional regulator with XRE-family HTH domain
MVELREALGWSRETLAGRSGLSFNAVYSYETGRRYPQVAGLFALASAFGIEPHDLIDDEAAS